MVTKLRNNKILCILWVLFCSFFFIAAIKQYSIDSLDGYFCRHSTNHYSLVPTTTAAYTTEDISVSYTVVSYLDNITMPTASDYTGYTAFIFYMTMAGFLLCIVGGFFFNGFHPKLYQEVFLFLFFFCLFQLLGDSLPVLIYQNFGKLVWPFLFLCIVLGIICAVSLLCFLWSWNSKGFHGSLFGEWLFQKISAKKLSSQIFYVILTSFILSAAACAVLIRIVRTYFYNFQSSKFFVPFFVFASLIIFISILFFFLIGRHSITADMDLIIQKSIRTTLEQERLKVDLITNISHDLKTPITAIKGYVEGIMDGVADTPEKMDRYVRTIYNKTNEMDHLINELTFYSKIDTNRIPYTFSKLNVEDYFEDCSEEVGLELETRGIELVYANYVEKDVMVIADGEQIRRVIHNIISNAIKYMDKPKGIIQIRIKDVGDFIQIEIEDNGKGIGPKDLPYIFDRFYRTDVSRNSSKGGSGIGLSIVKKILEDHGGKVWATSRLGIGTIMYFVLRKYQEVPMK